MKHVVKRLLEAEREGRQTALSLEAEGDELVRRAQFDCRRIDEEFQTRTIQQIEELQRQATANVQEQRQAIEQGAARAIETIQTQAADCREEAIASLVAILLGEDGIPNRRTP